MFRKKEQDPEKLQVPPTSGGQSDSNQAAGTKSPANESIESPGSSLAANSDQTASTIIGISSEKRHTPTLRQLIRDPDGENETQSQNRPDETTDIVSRSKSTKSKSKGKSKRRKNQDKPPCNPCGCWMKLCDCPLKRCCQLIAVLLIFAGFLLSGLVLILSDDKSCQVFEENCEKLSKDCDQFGDCRDLNQAQRGLSIFGAGSQILAAVLIHLAISKQSSKICVGSGVCLVVATIVNTTSFILEAIYWSKGYAKQGASDSENQSAAGLFITLALFTFLLYAYFTVCFFSYYRLIDAGHDHD